MLADLACAIAGGAEVISDFRVMGDQEELFGLVAATNSPKLSLPRSEPANRPPLSN